MVPVNNEEEMQNIESNSNLKKQFIKLLLEHNLIDPVTSISRKFMKTLGVLNTFDDWYYWTYRRFFRKVFERFWEYPITGESNFPKKGGAVVISNHQSELDPFLIGSACSKKVRWLSKYENFHIPIFKSFITPFGTIPIHRGQSDEKALNKVRNVLENGGCIGIFPEGTRSPDGKIQKFHKGAARLCLETGVPYVPCALRNAYIVFPKGETVDKIKFKGDYEISVSIGNPVYIDPSLEANPENARLIRDEMKKDIEQLHEGGMNRSKIITKEGLIILESAQMAQKYDLSKEMELSMFIKNQKIAESASGMSFQ